MEWTFAYAPGGRVGSITDPNGLTESFTYEPSGELKTHTDRNNHTTQLAHDHLGRLLSVVDSLDRKHQRSYALPSNGTWSGPAVMAASADDTVAAASLTGTLRNGDYQIAVNGLDVDGYPAKVSLYRDATFALSYYDGYDAAGRLVSHRDRVGLPIDTTTAPGNPASFVSLVNSWNINTSATVPSIVEWPTATGTESQQYTYNAYFDTTWMRGSNSGRNDTTYTRDTAGRVTTATQTFYAFDVRYIPDQTSTYTYRTDGRIGQISNPDGTHNFTYDARGLVATQTVANEGVYTYGYDELGRNTQLEYPDGHMRHQVFDNVGQLTSRCYEYPTDPASNHCYGASYDGAGNPVLLTDPDGADVIEYDALDRVKKVTREVNNVVMSTETYAYNALGALSTNASGAVDHQRPRLDGAGSADAAVPATLGGQPVTLDASGRVTSLKGTSFGFTRSGDLRTVQPPAPAAGQTFGQDGDARLVTKADGTNRDFYVLEGLNRIATIDKTGTLTESVLFDGVDHPLRRKSGEAVTYYELDIAGNVRHLRGPNGTDLGGYRYTAFGNTVENTASVEQPLRWKGRPHTNVGGIELYDMRARWWSPELGVFLSIDDFAYATSTNTLWGWPGQNPMRWSDPSGHYAAPFGPGLTAPFAPGGAISFEVGVAAVTPIALGALNVGIYAMLADQLHGLYKDLTTPTVGGGCSGGGDGNDSPSAPPLPSASQSAPEPQAAAGGAGKRIGGGGAPRTPHGQQRADEARAGDSARQVGDANRVIAEGRAFLDTDTGYTVYVSGARVVIVDSDGTIRTQFTNSRANTQNRIRSGKWQPLP